MASYLEIESASLIFWLCSNPKGEPQRGAIPIKRQGWLLPAWWVTVTDDVRDEALRPLTAAQFDRIQSAQYRSASRLPRAAFRQLRKPPRPYA
jgi:hypothetical protein